MGDHGEQSQCSGKEMVSSSDLEDSVYISHCYEWLTKRCSLLSDVDIDNVCRPVLTTYY